MHTCLMAPIHRKTPDLLQCSDCSTTALHKGLLSRTSLMQPWTCMSALTAALRRYI